MGLTPNNLWFPDNTAQAGPLTAALAAMQSSVDAAFTLRKPDLNGVGASNTYQYMRTYGIAPPGGGITSITWAAFPTSIVNIQLTLRYPGAIGTNGVIALYTALSLSGCGIVLVNTVGTVITSGAYDIGVTVTGY